MDMFLLLILPAAPNARQDTLLFSRVHHALSVVLGTILEVVQVFVVYAQLANTIQVLDQQDVFCAR